ncbi:hypothetical protein GCM10022255_101490 [Dactylosporangium darangshiense]|uniref:Uncharacterized protein n=1 Tax=Dactylosporangium darangshiense TaxID=579108 RepID=A0ABP8DSN6_9ACTN
MVLAHLCVHPTLDFSPAELANALDRRTSRAAIIKVCRRLVDESLASPTGPQQRPPVPHPDTRGLTTAPRRATKSWPGAPLRRLLASQNASAQSTRVKPDPWSASLSRPPRQHGAHIAPLFRFWLSPPCPGRAQQALFAFLEASMPTHQPHQPALLHRPRPVGEVAP